LTAGQGECSFPRLSPDGSQLAYVAREEGHPEVWVMAAEGGPPRRLTFMGSRALNISGWSADGKKIYFCSDADAEFGRLLEPFEVDAEGGMPRAVGIGHAVSYTVAKNGAALLGRNNNDPARWKRYRGGTAGELWVDPRGNGNFKPLIRLKGNLVSPMWIGGRAYFLSDHEGVGNIYSCTPDGGDLRRHTNHHEYYVRFPSTDGKRIVYTCGADLYVLDPARQTVKKIDVEFAAAPRHAVRRFVDAARYLEHYSVHPRGHSIGLISRGQPFTMPFWEEAVIQHGAGSTARYRSFEWLPDGNRFVVVNDLSRYERLEVHSADQSEKPYFVTDGDIGRVVCLTVSPVANRVAMSNHRHELLLIDVDKKTFKVIDRSPAERISGISWSPDGRWLAYSYSPYQNTSNVRVADTTNGAVHDITRPIRYDFSTSWDPEGRFVYFLSARDFNPIYDSMQFDLSFPYGVRPYLVTLTKDTPSPFVPVPKPLVDLGNNAAASGSVQSAAGAAQAGAGSEKSTGDNKLDRKGKGRSKAKAVAGKSKTRDNTKPMPGGQPQQPASPKPVKIDFDGIEDRILAFPVSEGRYDKIVGVNGRVIFTEFPLRTITRDYNWWDENGNTGNLVAYDFRELRSATLATGVFHFAVASDNRALVYCSRHNRLRVIDAGMGLPDSPPTPGEDANRKTGWLDIRRVNVMIEPYQE
jgi:tricorn protease